MVPLFFIILDALFFVVHLKDFYDTGPLLTLLKVKRETTEEVIIMTVRASICISWLIKASLHNNIKHYTTSVSS